MLLRPPRSTRTDKLLPYTTLFRANALRQALAPYVLGGAHGKLLDADHDRLGTADVQCFEMEELMASPAAVRSVLGYLFARFDERSEEHTSELQSLMRISYAVFCLKKKKSTNKHQIQHRETKH